MLSHFNEITLFFLAVVIFLITIEVGYRTGRRYRLRSDEEGYRHINALQTALVGLLALLLGFNFALASSRFDSRKALIQDESNAIWTAYLRAQLLPPAQAQLMLPALRAYLATRIEFMRAGGDEVEVEAARAEVGRGDARLWDLTKKMLTTETSTWRESSFVQSLNEMLDVKWKRRAALENHVPEPVIHLLFLVAIGSFGFIAYNYGATGRRRHLSTAIFALLIALVLAIILDFDRPNGGFIRVSDEEMVRLKAAMQE
jgi:hypothetical protein